MLLRAREVTTVVVLEARGAEDAGTLTRDLAANLFVGCEPVRVSEGKSAGVWYEWTRRAVLRAGWIHKLVQLGLSRKDIGQVLADGGGPGRTATLERRLARLVAEVVERSRTDDLHTLTELSDRVAKLGLAEVPLGVFLLLLESCDAARVVSEGVPAAASNDHHPAKKTSRGPR